VPPAGEHPDQAQPRLDLVDAAAALAEVGRLQAHALVAVRLEEHPLELLAGAALGLATGVDDGAGLAQARRHAVAQPLELLEAEQARAALARHVDRDGGVREGGGQRVGQLGLQARDLPAQRASGGPFVDLDRLAKSDRIESRISDVDHAQCLLGRV
jgi:hypothetical protein